MSSYMKVCFCVCFRGARTGRPTDLGFAGSGARGELFGRPSSGRKSPRSAPSASLGSARSASPSGRSSCGSSAVAVERVVHRSSRGREGFCCRSFSYGLRKRSSSGARDFPYPAGPAGIYPPSKEMCLELCFSFSELPTRFLQWIQVPMAQPRSPNTKAMATRRKGPASRWRHVVTRTG